MEYIECWNCGGLELHRIAPKSKLVGLLLQTLHIQAWQCDLCRDRTLSHGAFLEVDAYQPITDLGLTFVANSGAFFIPYHPVR
jgi:hypothetical protein